MTFERIWTFLADPSNREVLAWLGAGVVVILGGAWTVFKYFRPGQTADQPEGKPAKVTANHAVAAGHSIKGSKISITGSPQPGDVPRAGELRRRGKRSKS